jgi:hypothetical protein
MPHRYQLLEKFAFSLVVMSAVTCSSYIVWEDSPNFRDNVRYSKELIRKSGEYEYQYSSACAADPADPCTQFAVQ